MLLLLFVWNMAVACGAGDRRDRCISPDAYRHLETLTSLTPGDFATVCRQRTLLGEDLAPEQFLRRLAAECRLKQWDERRVA
ncbi:MAG: hypothetical protein ACH37Z_17935 [Anaerolineae bacterium]